MGKRGNILRFDTLDEKELRPFMKFNLNKRKTRTKEKQNTVYILTLFLLLSFVNDVEKTSFSSFSFLSRIFVRLRLRLEIAVFLTFLIFFARRVVDALFFLFIFLFVAISLSASIFVFVTLTKSEVSSWLDRWSFLFFSFISSTRQNQSRCVR